MARFSSVSVMVVLVIVPLLFTTDAFTQPTSAQWSNRPKSRHHQEYTRSSAGLAVVADAEKEETRYGNKGSPGGDWIRTKSGAFLPNLSRTKNNKNKTESPIIEIQGIEQYKREVVDEEDRIVCVRFYASWCRACKVIAPAFRRLPLLFPSVKFVEVPVTKENTYLHQGLGITTLPFAHLYHPGVGLVEERKVGRKNFRAFRDIMKTYVEGSCSLPVEEDN
eukprot:CAMPEP_0198145458 /NCGR_PEP_ID=MMETSP1443-20131203/23651_1 /TAXON_ID=186043 /ORGANISM="Entomoneis sp., Strain CCMP2396" /LENGTH=220 /DNA_ID=CAMNT_0043809117 /DNA_START=106 /DNA_END=765 /DNA_ORIENTATION=+